MLSIEDMARFCKRKGFVYPSSEIYGGMSGFFDYGPLGVELKNNIKNNWWKNHVQQRADVIGIDGSIIANPKVWEASGHTANFSDFVLTTKKSKTKVRADHFIEDKLKIDAAGLSAEDINKLIKENDLKHNGEEFEELKNFNLMFETKVGPEGTQSAYLRPETAQIIFKNFKLAQENARMKLPFGIAQIGKVFRNEISPRDFLFRCREFEQMEIEYFVSPKELDNCPFIKDIENVELNVLTEDMQKKKNEAKPMKIKDMLAKKLILQWHAYWLAQEQNWFTNLGVNPKNLRVRQHHGTEKAHYATDTWDFEYKFPFGWKELEGISNRGDYDLQQHMKASGADLHYFDPETNEKVVPHVIAEPSLGVDRTFLVFLFEAYTEKKDKQGKSTVVLKLNPKLAPFKAAVFPLKSNNEDLTGKAKEIFDKLTQDFAVFYDQSGSIGRRYARQDEIGTPYCITVDFDTLEDGTVTIRDRDSTEQKRIKIEELNENLYNLLYKDSKF